MAVTFAPTSLGGRLLSSCLVSKSLLQETVKAVGEDDQSIIRKLIEQGVLTRFQGRQMLAGSTSLMVGKYVVVDCLGRGGNGIVLKAKHQLMANRFVALKTVDRSNLHQGEEAQARFRREIDILAQLDHPHIVRALDVIETRSQTYLVLEFVDGIDLGRQVAQYGPIPLAKAVKYTLQTAMALSYAHKKGIIHRDVKPTNLLVNQDDMVKLADLGLARFTTNEPSAELTMKGLAIGTPEFMAPEQAENAMLVGPLSDVYSLGATLFHLLTGSLPLQGSSYLHKLQQLLMLPPRPLQDIMPSAPAELARIVDRMRARKPEDRPASCDEVIALLQPFATESSVDIQIPDEPNLPDLANMVMQIFRGKLEIPDAAKQFDISENDVRETIRKFVEGGRLALSPNFEQRMASEEVERLHAKIGAQAMEIERLREELQKNTSLS